LAEGPAEGAAVRPVSVVRDAGNRPLLTIVPPDRSPTEPPGAEIDARRWGGASPASRDVPQPTSREKKS
jgi:hypothetical protein